ncbi:MAG: tetratricopeptide repeat protein [Rhizobiales bacterium]|nr:tetratricopeptide repeat protein [Hyphomicrobiales bacterium]
MTRIEHYSVWLCAIAAIVMLAAVHAAPASAMGEDSSSEPTGTSDPGSNLDCPDGFEVSVDPETKEASCVPKSSELPQELPATGWNGADPDFVDAAVLVHSGAYRQAITALNTLGRPDDPYVLNYLGFAHRKLGETDAALAYYHKALALRPDYTRARSYLGEGYVALGRIDEARRQLALIEAECGSSCEEYRVLDAAISGYLARHS